MNNKTRNFLIGIVTALTAIISSILIYMGQNPVVSPDASVISMLDGNTLPSPSDGPAKVPDSAQTIKPDALKLPDAARDAAKVPDAAHLPDAFVWKDAAPLAPDAAMPAPFKIGEWTDSPGVCPTGTKQVTVTTTAGLLAATRGISGNGPGTCYFIKNGTYQSGTDNVARLTTEYNIGGLQTNPIYFIGESRAGVIIKGLNWMNTGNIIVKNLTYSLVGMTTTWSFTALTVQNAANVGIDHVTFTSDCLSGGVGAHIELLHVTNVLLDSVLVEKYGSCSDNKFTGRDQGAYIESGNGVHVTNSIFRLNSSRGIQLYTGDGSYGTLSNVLIDKNRIYSNGHSSYQDGIVITGSGGAAGLINGLTIQNNIIYSNYFSGIRIYGPDTSNVVITKNTFVGNASANTTSTPGSAVYIDESTSGKGVTVTKNIMTNGPLALNQCPLPANGFALNDNVIYGMNDNPSMTCISLAKYVNPQLDANYVPQNAAVVSYGAYSN